MAWKFCMNCYIYQSRTGYVTTSQTPGTPCKCLPIITGINNCLYQYLLMPVLYFVYCLAQLQLHSNKPKIFLLVVFSLFDPISLDFILNFTAVFGKLGFAVKPPNTVLYRETSYSLCFFMYILIILNFILQLHPRET